MNRIGPMDASAFFVGLGTLALINAGLAQSKHRSGNPDSTTPFPAKMEVDDVRIYERTGPRAQGQGEASSCSPGPLNGRYGDK